MGSCAGKVEPLPGSSEEGSDDGRKKRVKSKKGAKSKDGKKVNKVDSDDENRDSDEASDSDEPKPKGKKGSKEEKVVKEVKSVKEVKKEVKEMKVQVKSSKQDSEHDSQDEDEDEDDVQEIDEASAKAEQELQSNTAEFKAILARERTLRDNMVNADSAIDDLIAIKSEALDVLEKIIASPQLNTDALRRPCLEKKEVIVRDLDKLAKKKAEVDDLQKRIAELAEKKQAQKDAIAAAASTDSLAGAGASTSTAPVAGGDDDEESELERLDAVKEVLGRHQAADSGSDAAAVNRRALRDTLVEFCVKAAGWEKTQTNKESLDVDELIAELNVQMEALSPLLTGEVKKLLKMDADDIERLDDHMGMLKSDQKKATKRKVQGQRNLQKSLMEGIARCVGEEDALRRDKASSDAILAKKHEQMGIMEKLLSILPDEDKLSRGIVTQQLEQVKAGIEKLSKQDADLKAKQAAMAAQAAVLAAEDAEDGGDESDDVEEQVIESESDEGMPELPRDGVKHTIKPKKATGKKAGKPADSATSPAAAKKPKAKGKVSKQVKATRKVVKKDAA